MYLCQWYTGLLQRLIQALAGMTAFCSCPSLPAGSPTFLLTTPATKPMRGRRRPFVFLWQRQTGAFCPWGSSSQLLRQKFLHMMNLALCVSLIILIRARGLLSFFLSDRTCQKVLIVGCPSLMWSSFKVPRVITGSTVCRIIGEVPGQEERSYVTYVPAQWGRNQGASRPLPCSWPWHQGLPKKRARGWLYTVCSPPIDLKINE